MMERRRPYLLLLASACLLFALGAASQILHRPAAAGPNAIASGTLYTAAVLLAAQGILLRSRTPVSWVVCGAVLAGFTMALGYFFYVDRNLLVRVYIQNFGYGLILLIAALRLKAVPRTRAIDRILFWVLLIFALHFFPRTLLTIGFSAPAGLKAFATSPFWLVLQVSLAVLGAALALAVFAAAFSDVIEDLRRERDIDALTGILNRRGFEEAMAGLAGSDEPASLLLCDVDRFKQVNDLYGHDAGDAVLQALGQILRDVARAGDVVGRFGGEEFMLFLPATDLREASACAERLRAAVAAHHFPHLSPGQRVTASFGVVQLRPGEPWVESCLYAAKKAGRNRIVTAPDDPE
jgi:diguanylate cyclase (GGDEF)-like protein